MYSSYKRQRILHFALMGHKAPTISCLFREEGLRTSHVGMHKFLQKYKETKSIERRPGCGRPTKMTLAVKALVERQTREDNETTAISARSPPQWPHHDSEYGPQMLRRSISLISFTVELSSIVYLPAKSFLNRPSVSSKRYGFPYYGKGRSVSYRFSYIKQNINIILSHTICPSLSSIGTHRTS